MSGNSLLLALAFIYFLPVKKQVSDEMACKYEAGNW